MLGRLFTLNRVGSLPPSGSAPVDLRDYYYPLAVPASFYALIDDEPRGADFVDVAQYNIILTSRGFSCRSNIRI